MRIGGIHFGGAWGNRPVGVSAAGAPAAKSPPHGGSGVPARMERSGWSPIATAPLDGTWICGAAMRSFSRGNDRIWMTGTYRWAPVREKDRILWSWQAPDGTYAHGLGFWMPLPKGISP